MASTIDYDEVITEVQDLASEPNTTLDKDLEECIAGAISRLQALLDNDEDSKLLEMIDRVQTRIAWLDEELHANYDRS